MVSKQIRNAAITAPQAQLGALLDLMADGVVILDAGGRIVLFNRASETMFGWAADEALGRPASLLFRSAAKAGPQPDGEVECHRRDGSAFVAEVSWSEIRSQAGAQTVCLLRQRPAEASEVHRRAEQAEAVGEARITAMDATGAALAHELNQPLTALMLYLQAAGRSHARAVQAHRRGEGSEALDRAVEAILEKAGKEAERASRIIQAMRQFAERREPERRLADLNFLVEDALQLVLVGARRTARIVRRLAAGLPPVMVDPVQIQQIIVNLVRNGLEAVEGADDPCLWIETAAGERTVRLAVRDNGPGVPASVRPHLFKAFSGSKRHGLGLGLAISRSIAQVHGGDLLVDPGGDGRGACFSLVLPEPSGPSS